MEGRNETQNDEKTENILSEKISREELTFLEELPEINDEINFSTMEQSKINNWDNTNPLLSTEDWNANKKKAEALLNSLNNIKPQNFTPISIEYDGEHHKKQKISDEKAAAKAAPEYLQLWDNKHKQIKKADSTEMSVEEEANKRVKEILSILPGKDSTPRIWVTDDNVVATIENDWQITGAYNSKKRVVEMFFEKSNKETIKLENITRGTYNHRHQKKI